LQREQQRNAALQQQLDQRTQETEQLRSEVQQLRERETQLRTALDDAPGAGGAADTAGTAGAPAASNSGRSESRQSGAMVTSLRAALATEQERRQAAETQLARLKEETNAPAFGDARVPEADYLAVKQEIVDLRKALADERNARASMADQVRGLQNAPPAVAPAAAAEPAPNPEDVQLRARLQSLESEKQSLVESFNRSLAASQQHTAELEQQLTAAKSVPAPVAAEPPPPDGRVETVRAENAQLKAQLDEEHKRTEDLAAKLRIAQRVTDLIFKIQTQPAPEPAKGTRRRR